MNGAHTAKEITAVLLDTLRHQELCLKEALRMIEKGEEMVEIIHVSTVITVVDESGNTIVIYRVGGPLLANISISYSKMYAAAALRTSIREAVRDILPEQFLYGLQQTHPSKLCIFGGGIPIMKNRCCIGGLGVSGGTVEQNMTVARHALSLD